MVLIISCFAFSFILFLLGYTFLGFWGEIEVSEFIVDVIKGGFFSYNRNDSYIKAWVLDRSYI